MVLLKREREFFWAASHFSRFKAEVLKRAEISFNIQLGDTDTTSCNQCYTIEPVDVILIREISGDLCDLVGQSAIAAVVLAGWRYWQWSCNLMVSEKVLSVMGAGTLQ